MTLLGITIVVDVIDMSDVLRAELVDEDDVDDSVAAAAAAARAVSDSLYCATCAINANEISALNKTNERRRITYHPNVLETARFDRATT